MSRLPTEGEAVVILALAAVVTHEAAELSGQVAQFGACQWNPQESEARRELNAWLRLLGQIERST